MSFVKKSAPPPNVQEGQVLKAKVVSIQKVESKWKDDEGNPREQLQFDLELEDGYKCRSWMAYYEEPSDRSKLGKLAVTFKEATKIDQPNVDEFLVALKEFGYVFVKVKGFREWEDELYPNFSIVTDKMPVPPQKAEGTPSTTPKEPATPEEKPFLRVGQEPVMTRGQALDISKNWPKADRQAWLDYLRAQRKLKD